MIDEFKAIKYESPVDKIIIQIRNLITTGKLESGDRLPSERKLAEKFGVGRAFVREAIHKLEFYGILKTIPQSGTVVAGVGIAAIEGLISDIIKLEKSDFTALVETRVILETNAAKLAAQKRTDDDILQINKRLIIYEKALKKKGSAVEEDLMFHLQIAEASKNNVLKSLMLVISPDILRSYIQSKDDDTETKFKALEQHQRILDFIVKRDSKAAAKMMKEHLMGLTEFSVSNKFQ